MKATEQYFPVVLFIMLYKVVLTFESVAAANYTKLSTLSLYSISSPLQTHPDGKQIRTRTVLEIQRLNKRC